MWSVLEKQNVCLLHAYICTHLKTKNNHNDDDKQGFLDSFNFGFSKSFFLSSFTYLEELHRLMTDLSCCGSNDMTTNGTSKKLKPYSLSSYQSGVSLSLMENNQIQGNNVNNYHHGGLSRNYNGNGITTKMVDSFFYQHKELQLICNFVIDLSNKNASKEILKKESIESNVKKNYYKHCFHGSSEEGILVSSTSKLTEAQSVGIGWYLGILRSVGLDTTFDPLCNAFNMLIQVYMVNAMNVSLSPLVTDEVREIATALSINHACCEGEAVVTSSIHIEVNRNIGEYVRKLPTAAVITAVTATIIFRL
jgi:hypothetical protein